MMPRKFLQLVIPFIISAGLLLSACGSKESVIPRETVDSAISSPVKLTTVPSNTADSTEMNSAPPGPNQLAPLIAESPTTAPQQLPLPTLPPGTPFGDEEARHLMANLSEADQAGADEALASPAFKI